ncbi:ABC transporter substrate-binding protein [Enterovirga rhinocerotis]|uniref:NitT/TauT family transport system substrate-binding protein n=1 Tax=Enterovirga rhinocerotis TaxID=1339210 RepID=A0A4R7C8C0_9HYPH|nr:ABC transporter substrate-binding protein [Enterovirga rhinocerotis]TDR94870.1 NitT/TauT family transport system substrate-binding protein [Enterovirga rhinocerotis]
MLFTRLLAATLTVAATFASLSAAAQTPVRVGVIPIVGASPLFVANGSGALKAAGMDVRVTTFESGPNMIQALASGTIDVYVAGIMPLAVANSKGVRSKVVTATAVEEMVFVAGPKLAPYFKDGVPPAEALKAYRAKEGKAARLAAQPPGSVPNTTLQHWLWEVAKADKADADIVSMGIDATQQAVLVGAVEGAAIREPALTIVQGRNPNIKLIATGGQMFPSQPGTVVAVTPAFAAAHPAAVQALVTALVQAERTLKEKPSEAAPHVAAALGKGIVDPATIAKALTSPASRFISDPRAIVEATAKMQAYQVSIGTLDKEAPLDGLFEPKYYLEAVKK